MGIRGVGVEMGRQHCCPWSEKREEPSLTKVKYSEKGKETNIPDDCDMVMTSEVPAGLTACWRLPADTAWCRTGAWVVEVLTLLPQRGEGLSILAHFMPPGARCRVQPVPGDGCMVPTG